MGNRRDQICFQSVVGSVPIGMIELEEIRVNDVQKTQAVAPNSNHSKTRFQECERLVRVAIRGFGGGVTKGSVVFDDDLLIADLYQNVDLCRPPRAPGDNEFHATGGTVK